MRKVKNLVFICGCAAWVIVSAFNDNVSAAVGWGIATIGWFLYIDTQKALKPSNPYKSELIKTFRPSDGQCKHIAQIYTRRYGSNVEYINYLVQELKNDFPGIKDDQISIHQYGGQRVKGIFFVEASFDRKQKVQSPGDYEIVKEIEYIL